MFCTPHTSCFSSFLHMSRASADFSSCLQSWGVVHTQSSRLTLTVHSAFSRRPFRIVLICVKRSGVWTAAERTTLFNQNKDRMERMENTSIRSIQLPYSWQLTCNSKTKQINKQRDSQKPQTLWKLQRISSHTKVDSLLYIHLQYCIHCSLRRSKWVNDSDTAGDLRRLLRRHEHTPYVFYALH